VRNIVNFWLILIFSDLETSHGSLHIVILPGALVDLSTELLHSINGILLTHELGVANGTVGNLAILSLSGVNDNAEATHDALNLLDIITSNKFLGFLFEFTYCFNDFG